MPQPPLTRRTFVAGTSVSIAAAVAIGPRERLACIQRLRPPRAIKASTIDKAKRTGRL